MINITKNSNKNISIEDIKITIVHYTPLVERKIFLKSELDKRFLNYTFIEDYDREVLTSKDLEIFNKNLKRASCSIFLNHLECFLSVLLDLFLVNL